MSTATDITPRIATARYLVRAADQTVSLELYYRGEAVEPADGTYTLFEAGEDEDSLATGAIIPGDSSTYDVSGSDIPSTLEYGRGYREEWDLTFADGSVRKIQRPVALVRHELYPVVVDADLVGLYSDIEYHLAEGDTSFWPKIDEAWKRIQGRLEAQNRWAETIWTPEALRELHLELAIALQSADFSKRSDDVWGERYERHKKEFELGWKRLRFVQDSDQDGVPDSNARVSAEAGVVMSSYTPYRRYTFGGLGGY